MLIEKLLRLEGVKAPFIPTKVLCVYWREIIRGRFDLHSLTDELPLTSEDLVEFRAIFIDPYTRLNHWTRAEHIKLTYMVEDLFVIADQKHRLGIETTPKEFLDLLKSYDMDSG